VTEENKYEQFRIALEAALAAGAAGTATPEQQGMLAGWTASYVEAIKLQAPVVAAALDWRHAEPKVAALKALVLRSCVDAYMRTRQQMADEEGE
jgi:hypothetical protein